MKISGFTFGHDLIERDYSAEWLTYRLFSSRITVSFNAVGWLVGFWLCPKNSKESYARGGIGFCKLYLSIGPHTIVWFDK